MIRLWLCACLTLLSLQSKAAIDDSVEIFFPQSLKYLTSSQTEFPFFWWNFVIVEAKEGRPDFEKARELCAALSRLDGETLRRRVCNDDLSSFKTALDQWSADLILRESYQEDLHREGIAAAIGSLAMMSSSQTELLQRKRIDPLDEWQNLLERSQVMTGQTLQRELGFLVEPQSFRIVIPLQFAKPPKRKNAEPAMLLVEEFPEATIVGAHVGAYMNEKQVDEDLSVVSLVSAAVLAAFVGFLALRGRWRAVFLVPPMAISIALAAGVVHLIYGSIHGLTLAFGSGIIGLGLDYGLHGAFNSESKQTWKSNLVGLLTTLAALIAVAFSSIPLLQQMMTFAIFGIVFCFLSYYFLCRNFPRYFTFASVRLQLPPFRWGLVVVALLIATGLWGSQNIGFDFDLRRFNFQSSEQRAATEWFFTLGKTRDNLLLIRPKSEFESSWSDADWANREKISYLGVGSFLPSPNVQAQNIASWEDVGCPALLNLSAATLKAFEPFVTEVCRIPREPLLASDLSYRDYLTEYVGPNNLLSVFVAKTNEDEAKIKAAFPQSQALAESLKAFAASLNRDISWIIPFALLVAALILALYYRRLLFVFSAYIPFLSGLGLFFAAQILWKQQIDLISVLGLLMVFGFSLDYGVFAVDVHAFPQGSKTEDDVHSALCLAAISNIVGFFPMLFAKHAMLHQLGTALFFGTIGTYIGAVWGVGPFIRLVRRGRNA